MLTVQVGQCGNQLGCAMFDKLAAELGGDASPDASGQRARFFFRDSHSQGDAVGGGDAIARAVLVDMEPKVVQQCLQPSRPVPRSIRRPGGRQASSPPPLRWAYDRRNAFTRQSGAGNNWAFGFKVLGAQAEEELLALIQAEAERCDLVRGFLTLQSAAGGTGSGLGSLLSEVLADEFGASARLNAIVWPHQSGEVIVQNYNAVLTVASLVDAAHGVFLLQNDAASAACQRLLRIAHPSFTEMNDVLATHLAAALIAVDRGDGGVEFPFGVICRELCAHPAFKLLDVKTVPQMPQRSKQFTTHTWPGLLRYLHQMQVSNDSLDEGIDWSVSLDSEAGRSWNRAVGSVLMARGPGAREHKDEIGAIFRDPRMYTQWTASPFTSLTSETIFNAYDKTATLVSNSKGSVMATLEGAADRAYRMFANGAYVHQYERYSVDREFFQGAFLRVDQVVRSYSAL